MALALKTGSNAEGTKYNAVEVTTPLPTGKVITGTFRTRVLQLLKESAQVQNNDAVKMYTLPAGEYFVHFIGEAITQLYGPYQFGIVEKVGDQGRIKVFLTKLFDVLKPDQRGTIIPPLRVYNTPNLAKRYAELKPLG